MTLIIGIDPGLSGAVAFFDADAGALRVEDMPILKVKKGKGTSTQIDLQALANMLDGVFATHAYLERVGASPQMGVTSAFNFGLGYGAIRGILAANFVPTTLITPIEWKRALKCPTEKDGARARASQLLPAHAKLWPLKKHDGRAEAAMLAYYGATK